MSTLIRLICLLFIRATHVVSQSLCGTSSYLEVKEGRSNTFVCTGLTPQQKVYWSWGSRLVSTCDTTSCSEYFSENFQSSKIEGTSSSIIPYVYSFPDLDTLATTSLTCQQESGSRKVTCQLDVVYPAEDPKCQIGFSGDTWEVTGWCNVSKARSRRNRYGCLVNQTSQQPTSLVGNFTMTPKPISGTNYSSGECQIKIALPPEGNYNYSVTIIPGEVHVLPSFNGSNEIRRPSESPTHNCPQYVKEGEDINCLCTSDDLGLPSGSLVWKGADSPRLKMDKVNRSYSGTINTCNLMWNNTAVQSREYTVTVNYAPRVQNFRIENKADDVVNVTENSNVSVACRADGRPLPTISLYKRGSDNPNSDILVATNVSELQYTINVVNCEAAYNYSCKSENYISMDQRNILLIVLCSPKKATNDSYFTTFVDGEANLTLKMKAYPLPKLLSIFYNGSPNKSISQKVDYENTVRSTCSFDSSYSSMITCTVTLQNETIYVHGFYSATFGNGLGNTSFAFEVTKELQTTTNEMKVTGQITSEPAGDKGANFQIALGAGLGAGLGLACVVVIVLVVINVRQRRMISRQHDELQGHSYSAPAQIASMECQEHDYGEIPLREIKSQRPYQNLESLNGEETTPSTAKETVDQDTYHIYEVPKEDENTSDPVQEDFYENKAFS